MNDPTNTKLRIRELRKERGLSQERLAAAAGCTTGTINKAELGKTFPRLDVMLAIARALGCEVSDLTGERS